jgi:hypothetical protein
VNTPEDIVSYFDPSWETVQGPNGGKLTRQRHMTEMKRMGATFFKLTEVGRGAWRNSVLVIQGWVTEPSDPAAPDLSGLPDMLELPPRWRGDPDIGFRYGLRPAWADDGGPA